MEPCLREGNGKGLAAFMVPYQLAGTHCKIMTQLSHSCSDLIPPRPCHLTSSQNIEIESTVSSGASLKSSAYKGHSLAVTHFSKENVSCLAARYEGMREQSIEPDAITLSIFHWGWLPCRIADVRQDHSALASSTSHLP